MENPRVCKYHSQWYEEGEYTLVEDGEECVVCVYNQERKYASSKPSKITVNKKVFWSAGGKNMEGKVKQIFSDHVAVIASDKCEYIVLKECLSVKPVVRTAQRIVLL